ncbi:MAG TPA: YheC/YheD family protein [Bacillota bacterium]|nr:YheC/YheD family protein [Bacillota bacterium]
MSIIRVPIQLDEKSDFPYGAHLLISQRIQQQLDLPIDSLVTLQLGQKMIPCKIHLFTSKTSIVRIRKDIGKHLVIPNGVQLNMKYEPASRVLILGPVFGVLISKLIKTSDGIFGPASSFCKEIVQGAKGKGIISYIFTLNDLDQENQTIRGWIIQDDKWVQKTLPYPDSVYNRLASRKQENAPDIQEFFTFLKENNIPMFNEHFLNKWQVHKALITIPQAQPYLPTTQLYKGFPTIKEALDRYQSIYLKPTNGSLGKGIYRISKLGSHYMCQYSTMSGSVQKTYSKLSDLYQSIVPHISKIPYLVQQGLNLIKINGNPLDFRSLVQKDTTGKWSVTSIVGRSGQNQSIVSNLARGGTILGVGPALLMASPWNTTTRPTTAYLRKISLSLAQYLEQSMPGHFAELGIDLAVDTSGKVWLLEMNAKPSKNDDQVLSHHKTRPSVKRLLDYALYLKSMIEPKQRSSASLKKHHKKRKKR